MFFNRYLLIIKRPTFRSWDSMIAVNCSFAEYSAKALHISSLLSFQYSDDISIPYCASSANSSFTSHSAYISTAFSRSKKRPSFMLFKASITSFFYYIFHFLRFF